MELTPQLLAEVEFRDTLRGYDRDEVDTFLEQVGVAIAQLQGRLREALSRAEMAEARGAGGPQGEGVSTDTITRTLLLAQRTADATVAEAETDARRMVTEAQEDAVRLRSEAEADRAAVLAETENEARQVAEEARRDLLSELQTLESAREQAQIDLRQLEEALDGQRTKLLDAAVELTALAEGGRMGEGQSAHTESETDSTEVVVDDGPDDEPAPAQVAASIAGDAPADDEPIDLSDRGAPYDVEADRPDVDLSSDTASSESRSSTAAPDEPAAGSSVFPDAGPATQSVDVLEIADSDPEADEIDDVFVRQLRDAVGSDPESDAGTMSEFFDEEEGPRRLFGRKSE
ncbi:MAG: DivIVA domain-containing protein [Acidimicrobiia bacterium]|nr:DivIVA domain-containing protein [Acidimicrobiia bacterium]MDH5237045.1 DivIVA domain-containing protein [Acidimicrobiia bacterium]